MSGSPSLRPANQAFAAGTEPDAAVERIRALRRQTAASLLSSRDDDQALAAKIPGMRSLIAARIPCNPGAEDLRLTERILEQWAAAPSPPPRAVLAAMALLAPHHMPSPPPLSQIPGFLRHHYVRFLLREPAIFLQVGEADRFATHRTYAMARIHDAIFRDHLPDTRRLADAVTKTSNTMLYFNEQNLCSYFQHRAEIIEWLLSALGYRLGHLQRLTSRAIPRVGVLHTVTSRTEASCLLAHLQGRPPGALELILYRYESQTEALSADAQSWVERVISLPRDVKQAVGRIREDDLDLLIIANNITHKLTPVGTIAAHRLARVQVVAGSSPVSPGFSNCDLYLSGNLNDPAPDAQDHYAERLALVQGTVGYYATLNDQDMPAVRRTRAEFGIANDRVLFYSAANYFKIIPEVIRAWAEILSQEPDSLLMLMPFNPNWGTAYPRALFRRRLDSEFLRFGVLPRRVRILDAVPTRADLHAIMALADVYLDSFPFSGACSLVDPLQLGLPIVASDGRTLRTTVAAAVLRLQGLDEMICATTEAYVERALRLARDAHLRQREQGHIRQTSVPDIPCLITEPYAKRFAEFCVDAFEAWKTESQKLLTSSPTLLRETISKMIEEAHKGTGSALRRLTDLQIITELIVPYFRIETLDGTPRGHMIDIGACAGQAALPLLQAGFTAEMIDPDPECTTALAAICLQYPGKASHRAAAAIAGNAKSVVFRKRSMGLSSLGDSPMGEVLAEVSVGTAPVRELCRDGTDFIKIDAEGFDLEILEGIDFEQCKPKLIMVEYALEFEKMSRSEIAAALIRMNEAGYGALIFENRKLPGFGTANWDCELADMHFGPEGIHAKGDEFGNIVFFRKDDILFLACLAALLESYLPARQRPAFPNAASGAPWTLPRHEGGA
jgi:FkbM family methyltransferase